MSRRVLSSRCLTGWLTRATPPRIEHRRLSFAHAIGDEHIAWIVQLHHSQPDLEALLPQLRRIYPSSRVVLIADGDGCDYSALARAWRCEYVRGAHLMTLKAGHLYVRRMLEVALAGPQCYCLRIDPDVMIWRRLRRLPAFTSLFGTLETVTEGHRDEIRWPANVQGGCIGLTRDAADAILSSGVLCSRLCAADAALTWARCSDARAIAKRGRVSDDFLLSWAAGALNIPVVECPEIRSRWLRTPANHDRQYAITHPHKRSVAGWRGRG